MVESGHNGSVPLEQLTLNDILQASSHVLVAFRQGIWKTA